MGKEKTGAERIMRERERERERERKTDRQTDRDRERDPFRIFATQLAFI